MPQELETLIETHMPDAVARIQALDQAGRAVYEMRQNSGPISSWSAHQRLRDKQLFAAFQDAADALAEMARSFCPNHWALEDWRLRAHRDGRSLRWAGRQGQGRDGLELKRSTLGIGRFLGLALACGTRARRDAPGDHARCAGLSRDPGLPHRFSFPNEAVPGAPWVEGPGKTPQDAHARLVLTGRVGRVPEPTPGTCLPIGPAEGFPGAFFSWAARTGFKVAARPARWSAAPSFWENGFRRTVIRRLINDCTASSYQTALPPWGDLGAEDLERFDAALAALSHRAGPARPAAGPLYWFRVGQPGQAERFAKGRNPDEAAFCHLAEILQQGQVPPDPSCLQIRPV